jgi:hypothetical protein
MQGKKNEPNAIPGSGLFHYFLLSIQIAKQPANKQNKTKQTKKILANKHLIIKNAIPNPRYAHPSGKMGWVGDLGGEVFRAGPHLSLLKFWPAANHM